MGRRRPSVFLGVFLREVDRNTFFFFWCTACARWRGSGATSRSRAVARAWRAFHVDAALLDAIDAALLDGVASTRHLTRSAAPRTCTAADSPGTRPRTRDSSPQKRGRAASLKLARGTVPSRNRACAYNNPGEPYSQQHPRRRRGPRSVVGQLQARPSRSGLARSTHIESHPRLGTTPPDPPTKRSRPAP